MLKNRNLKRQSNIKRVFLALLLIVLTFSLLHALAEPGTVVTSGGRLNMRQSPDDKARIVTKIKNGKTVEVLDHADGWFHITYEGYEGYVKEQYIKLLSAAIGQEIYSNGMTLYLRESMDATSRIVGMVNSQQTMKVEQIDDGWILVASGVVKGYVRTEEIDQLNEEPAAVATQKWTEGILQKETTLYRDPDKNSEVLSTWPKGQGVSVCPYNKDWSLIQIQDENICGFARKASVSLSPLPTVQPDKQVVDESQYISSSKAKSIAEKALKKYSGFNAKTLVCSQDTALSTDGIRGPMFRFNYTNKQGQYVYAAYIHAYTGEVLYTGDFTGFASQHDTSDLRTSPPKTTQDPQWWYDEYGNVVWDRTPEPQTGTDIGKDAARSVADRYLGAKYPRFSQLSFSRVACRHATDPTEAAGFQVPYYQFDYFVNDGSGDSAAEQLAFSCIVNAYTKEIEYSCAASLDEGNG
jgi:SH3-like domain-containing protein